jgi:hypothetical protein
MNIRIITNNMIINQLINILTMNIRIITNNMSINQLINILTTNTKITMNIRIITNNMVSLMTIMIIAKDLTLIIKKKTILNKLIKISICQKINMTLKRNLPIRMMHIMIMTSMRIKKRNHHVRILMRSSTIDK